MCGNGDELKAMFVSIMFIQNSYFWRNFSCEENSKTLRFINGFINGRELSRTVTGHRVWSGSGSSLLLQSVWEAKIHDKANEDAEQIRETG